MMKISVMAYFKALFYHLSGWFEKLSNSVKLQFVLKKIVFESVKYFPTFCGISRFFLCADKSLPDAARPYLHILKEFLKVSFCVAGI
jgi:hypothetical protein